MLRFAFRSPYERRIAPSQRDGKGEGEGRKGGGKGEGGGEGRGEKETRAKSFASLNATQFRYRAVVSYVYRHDRRSRLMIESRDFLFNGVLI